MSLRPRRDDIAISRVRQRDGRAVGRGRGLGPGTAVGPGLLFPEVAVAEPAPTLDFPRAADAPTQARALRAFRIALGGRAAVAGVGSEEKSPRGPVSRPPPGARADWPCVAPRGALPCPLRGGLRSPRTSLPTVGTASAPPLVWTWVGASCARRSLMLAAGRDAGAALHGTCHALPPCRVPRTVPRARPDDWRPRSASAQPRWRLANPGPSARVDLRVLDDHALPPVGLPANDRTSRRERNGWTMVETRRAKRGTIRRGRGWPASAPTGTMDRAGPRRLTPADGWTVATNAKKCLAPLERCRLRSSRSGPPSSPPPRGGHNAQAICG